VQTSYLRTSAVVVIVDTEWKEHAFVTNQGAKIRDIIKDRVKKFAEAAKRVLYKKFLSRGQEKKRASNPGARPKKKSFGRRVRNRQSVYKDNDAQWQGRGDLIKFIDDLLLNETNEEGKYKADFHEQLHSSARQEPVALCKAIRERLDNLKKYMYNTHHDRFREFLKDSIPQGKTEIDLDGEISKCIEDSIQRLLLTRIIGHLTSNIKSKLSDELASLRYKLFFLRGKKQKFYGIPKKNTSRKQFYKSTLELQRMQKTALPNEKLRVLVKAAREMHREKPMLAGDDILPITIYVIVKSCANTDNPTIQPSDLTLMTHLTDPELGMGEYGYYLTVFSAAMEWIQGYDPNRVEKMQKTMEALKNLGF